MRPKLARLGSHLVTFQPNFGTIIIWINVNAPLVLTAISNFWTGRNPGKFKVLERVGKAKFLGPSFFSLQDVVAVVTKPYIWQGVIPRVWRVVKVYNMSQWRRILRAFVTPGIHRNRLDVCKVFCWINMCMQGGGRMQSNVWGLLGKYWKWTK